MKPLVTAILALSCLAPVAGFAQATDSGRYTYCWVKDTGKHEIWLSQIFPTPPGTDAALAAEFLTHVGTLGGAGDKTCVTAESREVAQTRRSAESAAIMRKRSFGIRIYDLHDVTWTPAAVSHVDSVPASVAAPAAPVAAPPVAAAPVAAPAVVAAPPIAAAAPAVPATAQPEPPAAPDIGKKIASDPFFQLPAGKGAALHRSGSRIVNKTMPVTSDSTMRRRAGSNQCHLEETVLAGEGGIYKSTASGETWAGFIPLSMNSRMSSQKGVRYSELKAVAIDKLIGKPFPLVAGNSFGWSVSYESLNNSIDIARYGQDWNCTVGVTAPASTSIPGMAGEQTEVKCRLSFVSLPAPPQEQIFIWYDAAGCFMQDPTR